MKYAYKYSSLLIIVLSLLLFTGVKTAHAQSVTLNPSQIKYPTGNRVGSNSAVIKQNIQGTLQQRALSEIQKRIKSLSELLTKINSLKYLTPAQKEKFATSIQAEITSLNTLSTKIQSDTDATILKTDIQSIVTSYRVYAVYIPQIRLLAGANSVLETTTKLSSLSARLSERITSAKKNGVDTTTIEPLLADMNLKITDANAQANTIITNITPLTPEGYPNNKIILQNAKANLQTAIQDIKTALLDARQIIQGLIIVTPKNTNASESGFLKAKSQLKNQDIPQIVLPTTTP
ncbi:MAG: hypothetical protein KBC00_01340 [Candidatus Levybacteria bacterium]|nr:hypothetical protein [Candidatus Levybacteria bacterium]MBP9814980.1 hypothetical protein [Candidatus Levybacteria bacterium]